MAQVSDAPRTDARFAEIVRDYGEWGPGAQHAAQCYAQQLERENERLREQISYLEFHFGEALADRCGNCKHVRCGHHPRGCGAPGCTCTQFVPGVA